MKFYIFVGTLAFIFTVNALAQEAPSVNELIARNNTEAGQLRMALGQMQEQTLTVLKDADQTQDELQDELEK